MATLYNNKIQHPDKHSQGLYRRLKMKEDKTYVDVFIIAIVVLSITLFTLIFVVDVSLLHYWVVALGIGGFGMLMFMMGMLLTYSWYNRGNK